MVFIKDVTFLSCRGSRIFLQLPHSTCSTHVFSNLKHGRDSLHFCSPSGLLILWAPPSKLLKTLLLYHDPKTFFIFSVVFRSSKEDCDIKFFKFHAALSSVASSCSSLNQEQARFIMASEGSTSSGVSTEVRIGSLEDAMGRLRAKLDDQDNKL